MDGMWPTDLHVRCMNAGLRWDTLIPCSEMDVGDVELLLHTSGSLTRIWIIFFISLERAGSMPTRISQAAGSQTRRDPLSPSRILVQVSLNHLLV